MLGRRGPALLLRALLFAGMLAFEFFLIMLLMLMLMPLAAAMAPGVV